MNENMTPTEKLLHHLGKLDLLNPDISESLHSLFITLAVQVPDEDFPLICRQVERLTGEFEHTPTKMLGQEILQEYFQCIENSARQLSQAGEIRALPGAAASPANGEDRPRRSFSDKLVLYIPNAYTALEQCKILNRADIPQPLGKAADAFRRRLEVVSHVTGIGFEILWRIDPVQTEQWFLGYLEKHNRNLDPEIIRDILEIILRMQDLSPELRAWIDRWSEDESLSEFWPLISQLTDKIYSRQALTVWAKNTASRDAVTRLLQSQVRRKAYSDENMQHWLMSAMENFGVCVENVIVLDKRARKGDSRWLQATLFAELRHIAALYPPIMILSYHLLYIPDGAAKLAMAILGLVGKGLEKWERKINRQSEKIILRLFLENLRQGESPLKTIEKLTFGDQVAYQTAFAELDLISQQFDSIYQRDKVISYLSNFYSSFRRDKLLGKEVTRRYRNLMRLLHEDYLRNTLTGEDFAALQALDFLHDLNGLAAAARHFLDKRRAIRNSLEEMLASEMEFKHQVRTQRLAVIRKILAAQEG